MEDIEERFNRDNYRETKLENIYLMEELLYVLDEKLIGKQPLENTKETKLVNYLILIPLSISLILFPDSRADPTFWQDLRCGLYFENLSTNHSTDIKLQPGMLINGKRRSLVDFTKMEICFER